MKRLMLTLFFVGSCVCLYAQTTDTTKLMTIKELVEHSRKGVEFVGNAELVERINANPKLILLDVRSKEEYDAGHLKGATWIERGMVEFTLVRTLREPDAEIVVYCAAGNRAAQVVKTLKEVGYKNVKSHLGIAKWIEEGYPIYSYFGEIKVVKLGDSAPAKSPDYYLDKRLN